MDRMIDGIKVQGVPDTVNDATMALTLKNTVCSKCKEKWESGDTAVCCGQEAIVHLKCIEAEAPNMTIGVASPIDENNDRYLDSAPPVIEKQIENIPDADGRVLKRDEDGRLWVVTNNDKILFNPLLPDHKELLAVGITPGVYDMIRVKDPVGVSGTGRVAEVMVFVDGHAAVRWTTQQQSTVLWDDVASMVWVHIVAHPGTTVLTRREQKAKPISTEHLTEEKQALSFLAGVVIAAYPEAGLVFGKSVDVEKLTNFIARKLRDSSRSKQDEAEVTDVDK